MFSMTEHHTTRSADAALVERMADGDHDALAILMRELGGPAYSLAIRITTDPQLAEEAVQDAFVELWHGAHSYDHRTGSVATWVLTYVRNKAIDRLRHEQRRRPRTADGMIAATVDAQETSLVDERAEIDPIAAAWASARSIEVRDALAELTHEHRQALELAYYSGLSQTEIADVAGVPLGTVKTRTQRALARLRDILIARGHEGFLS